MQKDLKAYHRLSDKSGKNIRNISQVSPGDKLNIRVTDGTITADVVKTEQ